MVMNAHADTSWSTDSATGALARYAPEAEAALNELIALSPARLGPLVGSVRERCAVTLSLAPVPAPDLGVATPASRSKGHRVALEFAEQFCVDVSSVGADMREALIGALGSRTGAFVTTLYVADWAPRLHRVLDELFGPDPSGWTGPARWNESDDDPWPAVDAFLRSVGRLRALDSVTTELVRLRQARQHNCRICKSLRSRSALSAGVGEGTFGEVDHYQDSTLSERHKAALTLTDAMIWQPGYISDDVIDDVRQHFSPVEAVELVLDLTRNASNKIAVATGSDEAHVSEGVEIYDVKEDGTLDFGLSAPTG
ncbi:carboxymuconolactone decarboxylase family protein [Rhodococcus daqingensis]|uniref:Carboxymuconolactone decarboxylase family protein n=1 Tax=Rhodococcus daqingensis TaxID=2479363 RepID=A0ABW2RUI9_9NOCA